MAIWMSNLKLSNIILNDHILSTFHINKSTYIFFCHSTLHCVICTLLWMLVHLCTLTFHLSWDSSLVQDASFCYVQSPKRIVNMFKRHNCCWNCFPIFQVTISLLGSNFSSVSVSHLINHSWQVPSSQEGALQSAKLSSMPSN